MKKTIQCSKCNGRGYFTYERSCTDLCGVVVCRCEVCQGKGAVDIPITNADRIRSMTDEELAKLLLDGCRGSKCEDQPENEWGSVNCFQCRMNWLKQPYKEEV